MTKVIAAAGVVVVLALSATVKATPYDQQNTYVGASDVTFEENVLTNGTNIGTAYKPQGVTFSNVFYNPVGPNPGTPNYNVDGVGDFVGGVGAVNPATINFVDPITGLPAPVTDATFSLASQPTTNTKFTSFLAGAQVATFTTSSSLTQTNNIYGFTNSLFDSIQITEASSDNANLIDNIHFNTVPEPATVSVLALGGLGLLARRRRA